MKKRLLTVVLILIGCVVAFAFSGCAPQHICSYTIQNAIDNYKASDATCSDKAKYYYSCSCGAKGTDTFESGEILGHSFSEMIVEPSLGKKGYTRYLCQCGDYYDSTYVEIEDAQCLEYSINKDGATCTITGIGSCTKQIFSIPFLIKPSPLWN